MESCWIQNGWPDRVLPWRNVATGGTASRTYPNSEGQGRWAELLKDELGDCIGNA